MGNKLVFLLVALSAALTVEMRVMMMVARKVEWMVALMDEKLADMLDN